MLGKERHNDLNDSGFVDQAWSEMAKMLDKEMPVATLVANPKPGRYGLLLLVLLIGFVSGIGTMFVLQRNVEKPKELKPFQQLEPAEPLATRPAHKEQLRSTTESEQMIATNLEAASIEKSIQNQFSKKTITQSYNNNSKQNINELELYSNSSSVIISNDFPESDSKNIIADLMDDSKIGLGANEPASVQALQFQGIKDYPAERSVMLAVNRLDKKDISLLSLEEQTPKLEINPLNTTPKMNFGFYLGTQTRNFKGMHGLTSGLYLSYRLDPKFSFRTGLGYSVIKGFQAKTIGVAEPLTPEFFEPIEANLNDYSTVASLENNQDLPFQSLHYLDLPLGLDYRMSDNFGILMGLKLSYLLEAKTDGYFSENLNEEESARLDDALYNSLRKTDVATVLGFGFYPSSNVGLELKYNHGLVDYTIDENWHVRQLNTNKTFELSLNYFLR